MAAPALESRKPHTAEDMRSMPRDGRKYELLNGQLIVSPAGVKHEGIGAELLFRIRLYLAQHTLGRVFGSSIGYELASGDVVSPDVSFVNAQKLPQGDLPDGFGEFAPDLAVEIVSLNDSLTLVEDKVQVYLSNGTQLVWVINPKLRKVTIHRADGSMATVRADGALDGESVLPGFTCALAEIL